MLNFEFADYADELDAIARLTTAELVAHLRRKSSGFSRGASKFRGVTRHHQHGRWEARIGRVMGNKCVPPACHLRPGFGMLRSDACAPGICIWAPSAPSWRLRAPMTAPPSATAAHGASRELAACLEVTKADALLCSAVTNFNISEYAGEDLGEMAAESAMGGAADGMLLGAEDTMGGAADAMFHHEFFFSPMASRPTPMDAHMAMAGAAAQMPQHGGLMHDDRVMMPGAMATHDFASFGNEGGWGFGL